MPKLGFYGLDTVPFRPCIFTDFLTLYIFYTKMGYLGVLGYTYTYGRKIKKYGGAEKLKKIFIYINTKHTPKHPNTPLLYIFCTKMAYLVVLEYIYTYGRKKIKKSMEQKKKKFFIYINTNHTTFPPFPPLLYIFCTIFTVIYPKIFKKL